MLDLNVELSISYELKEEYLFINSRSSSSDAVERYAIFQEKIAIFEIEELNTLSLQEPFYSTIIEALHSQFDLIMPLNFYLTPHQCNRVIHA